jgi:hypothetical protein
VWLAEHAGPLARGRYVTLVLPLPTLKAATLRIGLNIAYTQGVSGRLFLPLPLKAASQCSPRMRPTKDRPPRHRYPPYERSPGPKTSRCLRLPSKTRTYTCLGQLVDRIGSIPWYRLKPLASLYMGILRPTVASRALVQGYSPDSDDRVGRPSINAGFVEGVALRRRLL